jgi:ATP-dependent helicase Lhr and Lhr-like helicase
VSAFDRLHPALQHHIVNSLGWRSLTPLQEAAVEPVLDGRHVLLLAPTAGGKTEAAVFPLMSRMLSESWQGLSIVYLCPIRALLNNLDSRLSHYGRLVGRTFARWHGDVTASRRQKILASPPDVLLTTPESLELLLISKRVDHAALFRNLRAVIIDEVHAFAGDDRGWHLQAVLERVTALAGHELQRVALSATVGNPEALLDWSAGHLQGVREVVDVTRTAAVTTAEIEIDFVGNLSNAAKVIAALHRGEKRLVFCDSRACVEELARHLNEQGVRTFVSHSSLSLDQRTQAETAFSEATDCVIVATSTLELGIDVGDLDRVIQVDAPPFIASFLQRMGRTGRRPGTKRNCLFLATSEDSLLQAAAIVRLWKTGYVEPIEPPTRPIHLFAQQVLASVLQNDGIVAADAASVDERLTAFRSIPLEERQRTIDFMVATGWLWDDSGILRIGEAADAEYGRRHFMELLSIFDSPPLFSVKHGNTDLGYVHETTFFVKRDGPTVLLLGGRSWQVTHLDWDRRVAYVAPSDVRGKSRWLGGGQPLSFELCQSIRTVLATSDVEPEWSPRAVEALREVRQEFAWLDEASTHLVNDVRAGITRWWTFAGGLANAMLAERFAASVGVTVKHDNLAVRIADMTALRDFQGELQRMGRDLPRHGAVEASEEVLKSVKFADCVPEELVVSMLRQRLSDSEAVEYVIGRAVVQHNR